MSLTLFLKHSIKIVVTSNTVFNLLFDILTIHYIVTTLYTVAHCNTVPLSWAIAHKLTDN